MKKLILITLVFVMVILASCGDIEATKDTQTSKDTTGTDSITENTNTEQTSHGTQTQVPNTSDTESGNSSESATNTETNTETTEYNIRTELRLAIDNQQTNISRNGFILEDNGHDSANVSNNLIDGKASTKWCSTPQTRNDSTSSYWVIIDLDDVYDFNTYTIMGAGSHGSDMGSTEKNVRAWQVYISLDNVTWTLIDSVKDNTKNDLSIYVGQLRARYVKLNVTDGDQSGKPQNSIARIYEFQLYNLASTTYLPLMPQKNETVKESPDGKFLQIGSPLYCSILEVLSDNPLTIKVTTNSSKYTMAQLSEWSFIVDGKKYLSTSKMELLDDDKTVVMSIPSIPMSAGKEMQITLQMGSRYYTSFNFTPERTTIGWENASYDKSAISIKFGVLPNIKVRDSFKLRQGSNPHATTLTVITIDKNENIVYFHMTEDIGRNNFVSITFPGAELDFYIPGNSTNDSFIFEKGTLIGGIPTIYINLDEDRGVDQISHGSYSGALYSIYSGGAYPDIVDQPLEIKGRGNYSWGVSMKKPYTIKLGEKRGLLGMGRTRRWVLINNYTDKTMARNFLTLKTGIHMGMDETTECEYVNLVINGDYRGIYVLTQKIEIDDNVVDIDEENGGVLFEIEMAYRHGDHTDCIILNSGTHILVKTPDLEDFTEMEKNQFLSLMKIRLKILDEAMTKGYDEFSKYMDVKSFINWYILNEFTKNYDSAFVTSCYFYYDPADMKFHMGPLWDYDTCYGSQGNNPPDGYRVAEAPWYKLLLQDDTFYRMVRERYTELRDGGLIEWMTDCVYGAAIYLTDSISLEFNRWPGEMRLTDMRGGRSIYEYSGEVICLVDWIRERASWLDSQWFIKR